MAAEAHAMNLLPIVALLGSAIIAAPLFQRLGLGSILGYLAAGVAIGPFGAGVLQEPQQLLEIAELGVVMFLFLIGLEMRPSRLWGLRHQIFGLGLAQVMLSAGLLTCVGLATGFPMAPSFVAGAGFVLTSTAIVMRLLEEQGKFSTPGGQRIVAILILEDLAIVPLLALVAFLAPAAADHPEAGISFTAIAIGTFSIACLVVAGRYLLNPLFRILVRLPAREVMTAAALLVVLGAAYAMQLGGLSMALGAFLAGVLLSESTFRHQLEADIDPFRGILLGLFFLAVGMSLDLSVVFSSWRTILFYLVAFMIVKAVAIYAVARLFRAAHREALYRATVMAQGGEFAFVLYAAAHAAGIVNVEENAILTAIIILSMAITPVAMALLLRFRGTAFTVEPSREAPSGLKPNGLIIGFGRVGQIASQFLLARGHAVSIIDTDIEMIDEAIKFDFKVYFGDGTRLDILHAAGAGHAGVILVCVDGIDACTRIVELVRLNFPDIPVLARANDRRHAMELVRAGTSFQIRETFESAMQIGEQSLRVMGASDEEVLAYSSRIRERDERRFELELNGEEITPMGLFTGRSDQALIDISLTPAQAQPKNDARALSTSSKRTQADEPDPA